MKRPVSLLMIFAVVPLCLGLLLAGACSKPRASTSPKQPMPDAGVTTTGDDAYDDEQQSPPPTDDDDPTRNGDDDGDGAQPCGGY